MLAKTIILILLVAMVISLGAAMFSMIRDKGRGTGTVKALTYRVRHHRKNARYYQHEHLHHSPIQITRCRPPRG